MKILVVEDSTSMRAYLTTVIEGGTESYDLEINTDEEHRALHRLLAVARDVESVWTDLSHGGALVGRSIADIHLRSKTGAWIVAVHRGNQVLPIPAPEFKLEAGDRVGLIGDPEQIGAAERLFQT